MMIIVTMIVMCVRSMVMRGLGMIVVAMRIAVMVDGVATGIARTRTHERNRARKNGAEQRHKDNCLDHTDALPVSMIPSENNDPCLRIMP